MAFLAYMTLSGLHQWLKAQLIEAFIRDIFILIRLAIFGYSTFLTIVFWTFSYTLQGVFQHFIALSLFTYVKKHSFTIFIFHGRIFNISIKVVHELSVLASNISSDQGEFCTVPNIRETNQNDLGILSNLPKASFLTNSEPRHNVNREACPTKVLAGKKVVHATSQEVSRVEN